MATSLLISPLDKFIATSEAKKAHLKKIGFKKGENGWKNQVRPSFKKMRKLALPYTTEALGTLIRLIRKTSTTPYLKMQCARAILSLGFGKTKSARELGLVNVWKTMEYYRLTGIGMPEDRANELIEAAVSKDPMIKRYAEQMISIEGDALADAHDAENEDYTVDL